MTARTAARKRRGIFWAIGALVLVVAAVGFAVWAVRGNSSASTASKYATAQVTKDTIVVTVSASGNMVVSDSESVQPKVSGTVKDLYVSLGQQVKAGQTLYTIDNDDLDTSVTKAKSAYQQSQQGVQRANIALEQAEQNYDALESRPASSPATDDDYELAQMQIDSAKTGLSAAKTDREAALDSYNAAKADAAARTVKAPMAGTVTELTLTEGGSTTGSSSSSSSSSSSGASGSGSGSSSGSSGSSSSGALVISDLGSMIARVQVNEADLPSVKVGQKASLTFDAIEGLQLSGKVTKVAISGTNSSGVVTYDVDIDVTSLDGRVKPNMSVSAAITTNVRSDVLAVPNAAVKSDTNGSYVLAVGTNGTAQRTEVTVGAASDTMTEVTEGLTEGQTVVTADLSASSSSSSSNRSSGAAGAGGAFRMLGR